MNQPIGKAQLFLVCCVGSWALLISPASGQVNGPGPSPSSAFDVVLNLPGDEAIITGASRESVGGVSGQTTQLNVSEGGVVGGTFSANSGSEVNISGGTVGQSFNANSGSEVNISGGNIFRSFFARSGSTVNFSGGLMEGFFSADSGSEMNISGGSVNSFINAKSGSLVNFSGGTTRRFSADSGGEANISGGILGTLDAYSGSDVELIGGEFRLNGSGYNDDTISLDTEDVITGTLADGSSFIFSSLTSDRVNDVTLTVVDLPPIAPTPIILDAPLVSGTSGLRTGQELTVVEGGSLGDNFAVVDATLNVDAGAVGAYSKAHNSLVNISGGTVGSFFRALSGTEVNISGGMVGDDFAAYSDSIVNISGGTVGQDSSAESGSEVNISGGTVARYFEARPDSVVNISGGTVDNGFVAASFSVVNISGGTVGTVDANPNSIVNISGGTVGVGFDSRPGSFVNISGGTIGRFFEAIASDVKISGGTLGSFAVLCCDDVELIGGEFRLNGANFTGDTITMGDGDIFTGTLADGSSFIFNYLIRDLFTTDKLQRVRLTTVDLPSADTNPIVLNAPIITGPSGLRTGQELTVVAGGSLRNNFAVVEATLNVEAGTVGDGAEAYNSLVNVSGGTVGSDFGAYSDSVVNIAGGTVGNDFRAHDGSAVNISGGTVGSGFNAFSGSEVNISGGVIGAFFDAAWESVVNIRGSALSLDGTPMNDLPLGQPVTIPNRNVTLSGVLADGNPFSFYLNSDEYANGNFFSPGATITVTLEDPIFLGDCNQDGVVNFGDISSFIAILISGSFLAQADCNLDGVVNFSDIPPFIEILIGL